ncbi:MAG: hypothetical protein ACJ735_06165 [Actinomycetes bacterium]
MSEVKAKTLMRLEVAVSNLCSANYRFGVAETALELAIGANEEKLLASNRHNAADELAAAEEEYNVELAQVRRVVS